MKNPRSRKQVSKSRRPAAKRPSSAKRPKPKPQGPRKASQPPEKFQLSAALGPDMFAKGIIASEPPRDAELSHLLPAFVTKLQAVLAELAAAGTPFRLVEGFRTVDRQQWLFGQGRPEAVPYGRTGSIVTYKDGVIQLSNHQGDGSPGSGRAADCYPTHGNSVNTPPASDPVWRSYADASIKQGLRAGLDFPTLKDAPHVELPK